MTLKKSQLYSALWSSCDELRGGMDASQYKDYVLVLLFVKYVSDKYAGQPFAPITIPKGASFQDMVALKGKPDIGDQINERILGPLANANKLSDMPDFNDATKLGSGKEMVERLTNLVAIFENKGVSKGNITKIRLPVPPPPEQAAIAEVLADMDAEIAALDAKLTKARPIKQGMMQELLTGRIRLV